MTKYRHENLHFRGEMAFDRHFTASSCCRTRNRRSTAARPGKILGSATGTEEKYALDFIAILVVLWLLGSALSIGGSLIQLLLVASVVLSSIW
jgi:hypothetical protein